MLDSDTYANTTGLREPASLTSRHVYDEPGCRHTPSPGGYVAWHAWATEMSKTHRQVKCPHCGRWEVWEPKTKPNDGNAQ